MINLKLTVISSVLGLVLSLLVGMVSQVSIGYLLIRAILSAVLTGGIAAAASFVFKKFLADDAVTLMATPNTSSTGNIVDITLKVDEDVLPDAENSPPFYVSPESLRVQKPVDIYRMAAKKTETESNDTTPAQESVSGSENGNAVFKPQPLVSEKTPQFSFVPDTSSLKEEVPDTTETKHMESSGIASGNEELDELPDLNGVAADEDSVSDIISDSDFAMTDNTSTSYSVGKENKEVDVGNDTELMANTIRTLLKSEG